MKEINMHWSDDCRKIIWILCYNCRKQFESISTARVDLYGCTYMNNCTGIYILYDKPLLHDKPILQYIKPYYIIWGLSYTKGLSYNRGLSYTKGFFLMYLGLIMFTCVQYSYYDITGPSRKHVSFIIVVMFILRGSASYMTPRLKSLRPM